jgi:CheY-like chemotaxis protein
VIDAGMRAKALVRQILTFSRQSESDSKPLMLKPFIKEIVKFLKSTLPASIRLRLSFDCEHDAVLADPTQMQQVLMNLCTNAAHAMTPEGGAIDIAMSEKVVGRQDKGIFPDLPAGAYLCIIIRDSGCGIEKEDLPRIFDPFFTTKGVGVGTGLGLSVVHGIVTAHGGGVYAQSEAGKGSTFQVLLPSLSHPEIDAVAEPAAALPEGSETILAIEDEPVLGDIIKRVLASLGYRVTLFFNSSEALRYFRAHPARWDLALLDYNIPEMNGLNFCRELKKLRPDLPVILYTGLNMETLRRDAESEGVRRILRKPLRRTELAVAVRRVLDGCD